MRFEYVLLGLVALTSIHTSSAQCSNGLVGVQRDEICCDAGCGVCGGGDCGQLPGGSSNCCLNRIRDSGVMCSDSEAAPCIIENESMCDNGISGVQDDDICCDASCGTCGGRGCFSREGGPDSCCSTVIRDAGVFCDTTLASPCIINTDLPNDMCDNGISGVQLDDICCDASCGTCGGSGCFSREGGPDSCCSTVIRDAGLFCDTTLASPCIINTDLPPDMCDNGLSGVQEGNICCAASCGTCGGTGCANRPGGPDLCCIRRIAEAGMFCDTTNAAPCIIDVPMCSNGFEGFENDGVCCEVACGVCGGPGCGSLPGGPTSCCSNNINPTGTPCSVAMAAPCIIDN